MNRIMEMTTSTEYQMNIWDDESLAPYLEFARDYKLKVVTLNLETIKIVFPITDKKTRMLFKLQFGE